MPLYEYICQNCNNKTELLVPISERDNPDFSCPKCGKREFKRVISSASVKCDASCSGNSCSCCG